MNLSKLLAEAGISAVQPIRFGSGEFCQLDLSKNNPSLERIDLNDEEQFTAQVFGQLKANGARVGIGGYLEERGLYSRSELFTEDEPRTIHLGIDLWAQAGTAVYAPFKGVVHSFDNRRFHGDYGPVIILEHEEAGLTFYTLYGHLSTMSLHGLYEGKPIRKGEQFASLGAYHENFHWPPHLHFQLIMNMEGFHGDYPGVCKASEKGRYLQNCPNPEFIVMAGIH
ncbi:peptidoglycan DD-metalloendopeptidase family protein [Roseivirga thermotolerans]|uniref:M23ase beta-sheet core domain-containing protein n=1 Tax=Roseivirga thermotolerans TaxID=1758176 RepID=A0ABQ3I8P4_9BACT|nr:peptidoglycan DD-metalloendopeptidase family protein [Roseivirga thermotolerans]GHE71732.1 hypothetical protein GCM10011340_29810 [Roseivirga thermotolerans]